MKYLTIILIFFFTVGLISCGDSSSDDDGGTVATPVFDPEGDLYCDYVDVSIDSSTDGANIYYKFATGVTASDTAYSEEFRININRSIYAIAVKDGMTNSAEASVDYQIMGCGS